MPERDSGSAGKLVSSFLSGSWRSIQVPLSASSSELDLVTPLLYGSGAGGLGWWRVRETELQGTASAQVLHQAYRLQALQAKIHESKIQKIFRLFRAANVEPILIKGWAISRLYAQAGLRPFGDIDLFVRPEESRRTQDIVQSEEAKDCWVDLHDRISELEDRRVEDLFSRSQVVSCGAEQVRILALEDHFALLAIHMLKHGAWRPLWLCDLALLLELNPNTFDWKLCLGSSKRRANWILTAVGLAQSLLDAEIGNKEIAARASRIPSWINSSVLKEWNAPFATRQPPMSHQAPLRKYLREPSGLLGDLANRWPNPILATISVKGQFNRLPRLPYQLGNLVSRAQRFLFDTPRIKSQVL
jgi:hypothetical protein